MSIETVHIKGVDIPVSRALATGNPSDSIGVSTVSASLRQALALLFKRLLGQDESMQAVPEPSRKAEAEALREWAWFAARNDRGFQDDLLAAADRHERSA